MGFSIGKNDFEKLEMLLGRTITNEAGTLIGYEKITESDSQDFRMLSKGGSIDAINYLLYRLDGKGGLGNASSYIGHVVKGGMDHQTWIKNFYDAI